jgi:hypothetical protein
MAIHLNIIGVLLILLASIHIAFPRYFKWNVELKLLSLINRQMMVTHTFFIALTVCLMGILCITSAHDLIYTELGRKISLGMGLFWSIRLAIQIFGYSSKLWKGKTFETVIHMVFSCFWFYLSYIFLTIYF